MIMGLLARRWPLRRVRILYFQFAFVEWGVGGHGSRFLYALGYLITPR